MTHHTACRIWAGWLVLATGAAAGATIEGTWSLEMAPVKASVLTLRQHGVLIQATRAMLLAPGEMELEDGKVAFELERDAGRLLLEGLLANGKGSGTFRFVENPEFVAELKRVATGWEDSSRIYEMAVRGVPLASLRRLPSRTPGGPPQVTAFDLLLRHILAAQAQNRSEEAPELTDQYREYLQRNGVEASYLRRLRQTGYPIFADDAIRLHQHGVKPELLDQLRRSGYETMQVPDMLKLQTYGVSEFDLQKLELRGIKNLTSDEIVRMKVEGQIQ